MKRVQTIFIKALMLGLMLQGALLLLHLYGVEPIRGAIDGFMASIPQEAGADAEKKLLGLIAGWSMVALGLIGAAPLPNWRRNRAVTFRSGHGNITIQLDSVYRTMHKILNRMPEVRSCRLDIQPSPDGTMVCIKADARLYKLPRQRARATAMRVSDIIADTAMNFLGLEDMVSLDLNIQDFTVDIEESCKMLREEHGGQKRALTPELGAAGMLAGEDTQGVERGDARLEAFEEPAVEPMPDTPSAEWDADDDEDLPATPSVEWDADAEEDLPAAPSVEWDPDVDEGELSVKAEELLAPTGPPGEEDAPGETPGFSEEAPGGPEAAFQDPESAWLPGPEDAGELPPLEAAGGVFEDLDEEAQEALEEDGELLPPPALAEDEAVAEDRGGEPDEDKEPGSV